MKIRNQRLTVILVPQGGARTYSFQARADLLVAVGVAFAVILLVTITLMFTYGRYFQASRQTARLQHEVERLENEARVTEDLRRELQQNERIRRQVLGLMAAGTPGGDSAAPGEVNALLAGEEISTGAEDLRAREQDFVRSVPRSWPVRGPVTREFLSASTDGRGFHPGIDIAAPTGTPVRAGAAGTVTFAEWDPEYGLLVVLDHGMGIETRYGHNSRINVAVGDRVERGQIISAVGSTGRSTAPHLHFEIRRDGAPIDPRKYLE
jgi:murein DD-endopeptidase MepM/ murein hydrolase activator NlpD